METTSRRFRILASALALALQGAAYASSHREAPLITQTPKVDGTDFYMFNSYEAGRGDFVTIIANYIPLQDAYGGPNFFTFDENASYEIHIDNNGDAVEDLTFQFQFDNNYQPLKLKIGDKDVAIPLIAAGQVAPNADGTFSNLSLANLRLNETYSLKLIRGGRRTGQAADVKIAGSDNKVFAKPVDNIGTKTFPDYEAYAKHFVYSIDIPGCSVPGRVFVGQRKEPFVVNLGETFDLVNLNPLGSNKGEASTIDDKNVSCLILEVPKACLVSGDEPVIGGWTTASVPDATAPGNLRQVSRLGHPLVNEVVIGLEDKDRFNAADPKDDGAFLTYVTNPTLPALLEIIFPGVAIAPKTFPRQDLVNIFLLGVEGLNRPKNVKAGEILRLNTSIAAKPAEVQNPLGVLGGDTSGFPNGRRPGDDVVDVALRAVMGVLLPVADAPAGQAPLTDGAYVDATHFQSKFPYLLSPIPGSPNDTTNTPSLEQPGETKNRAKRNPFRRS